MFFNVKQDAETPGNGSSRRVIRAVCLLACSVSAPAAFGWGGGHEHIARLCGEYMPAEPRAALGEWNDRLVWWCHYPDMTEPGWGARRFMLPADMSGEIGAEATARFEKWGFNEGDWLHRHVGRTVLMTEMKDAFRTGRPKLAAFCVSVLSHAASDQGALNHTPILQFTSYSKFAGVDYGWKHGCGFTMVDKAIARRVRAGMAAWRPKLLAPDFREAIYVAAMDSYDQSEAAAAAEIDAAFGTKEEHDAAMARIVIRQVTSILDMTHTAWTLRNEPFELTRDIVEGIPRREEARRRAGRPEGQAVYHGLFDSRLDPPRPKTTVGFVLEPYGSFHVTALSYVGKMLGAATARTLRDAGCAVKAFAYWDLEKAALPPPSELPHLFIFSGRCSPMPPPVAENLKRYRDAGGHLVWVAGEDPENVTGLLEALVRRGDDEVPVSSKWAVQNEQVWRRMRVTFASGFGDFGADAFPFVRNPNFDGFCKPVCVWSVRAAEGVQPIVSLDNGKQKLVVGARRGNVTWLPEYLFLPFLFSADKTVNWADMRLDTFASRVARAAVGL